MRKINGRVFLFLSSLAATQLFCSLSTTVNLAARVYEDLDGNGNKSENEPWFPGVILEWEGDYEATDKNGIATFTQSYLLQHECMSHGGIYLQVPDGYYITQADNAEVNCETTAMYFKKTKQSVSATFGLAPILEESQLEESQLEIIPMPTEEITGNPALTLSKSVDHTTCVRAGEQFNYTYVITNTGDVPLSGPFTLTDDKVRSITCEQSLSSLILQPNESVACTGIYFSTDVESEIGAVIRNKAVASVVYNGQVVTSNTAIQEVFCTPKPNNQDDKEEPTPDPCVDAGPTYPESCIPPETPED